MWILRNLLLLFVTVTPRRPWPTPGNYQSNSNRGQAGWVKTSSSGRINGKRVPGKLLFKRPGLQSQIWYFTQTLSEREETKLQFKSCPLLLSTTCWHLRENLRGGKSWKEAWWFILIAINANLLCLLVLVHSQELRTLIWKPLSILTG